VYGKFSRAKKAISDHILTKSGTGMQSATGARSLPVSRALMIRGAKPWSFLTHTRL
jgi:hypothetical protein